MQCRGPSLRSNATQLEASGRTPVMKVDLHTAILHATGTTWLLTGQYKTPLHFTYGLICPDFSRAHCRLGSRICHGSSPRRVVYKKQWNQWRRLELA